MNGSKGGLITKSDILQLPKGSDITADNGVQNKLDILVFD